MNGWRKIGVLIIEDFNFDLGATQLNIRNFGHDKFFAWLKS